MWIEARIPDGKDLLIYKIVIEKLMEVYFITKILEKTSFMKFLILPLGIT